jgi:hypothetical protein
VSVNVGARQLQQADFVDRLRALLAMHPQVQARQLELELLETSALEDLARVSRIIEAGREIGVSFALDDFGTGYSSLSYLRHLPVRQIKIDRSFVRNILDDADDLAILEGVLRLSTAFRRELIAEGVETVEHGSMLLHLGCELAQGYGIARPMPAGDLPGWLARWRPDPAWAGLRPVNRDDLPLLLAGVEHRAWIAAISDHLHGAYAPPPVDPGQCHFGTWLAGDGPARHGARAALQVCVPLHRQLHALAAELCDLQARGQTAKALLGLVELHRLRDDLLGQFAAMVHSGRPQGGTVAADAAPAQAAAAT